MMQEALTDQQHNNDMSEKSITQNKVTIVSYISENISEQEECKSAQIKVYSNP